MLTKVETNIDKLAVKIKSSGVLKYDFSQKLAPYSKILNRSATYTYLSIVFVTINYWIKQLQSCSQKNVKFSTHITHTTRST